MIGQCAEGVLLTSAATILESALRRELQGNFRVGFQTSDMPSFHRESNQRVTALPNLADLSRAFGYHSRDAVGGTSAPSRSTCRLTGQLSIRHSHQRATGSDIHAIFEHDRICAISDIWRRSRPDACQSPERWHYGTFDRPKPAAQCGPRISRQHPV